MWLWAGVTAYQVEFLFAVHISDIAVLIGDHFTASILLIMPVKTVDDGPMPLLSVTLM